MKYHVHSFTPGNNDICVFFAALSPALAVTKIDLYFPPVWKNKPEAAGKIAAGLSRETGNKIIPHIADCYPEILTVMARKKPVLAYVGSMVSAIVNSRKLGTPLLQTLDEKQSYGGLMVVPKGISPSAILQEHPAQIAYSVGTTSGEVCAKAATGGKAAIEVSDHSAAIDAIRKGKAKAAFVKSTWWWEKNANNSEFAPFLIPGISEYNNADNVLLVSNSVTPGIRLLIMSAAIKSPGLFNADRIVPFNPAGLDFTLKLMKKAGIDPLTYSWQTAYFEKCAGTSVDRPLISAEPPTQDSRILAAGEKILENKCNECHLVAWVKKHRKKTRDQWEKTINRKGMGEGLTDKKVRNVINYLLSLNKKK